VSPYLLDILALELGEESVETLIISFDSDGFENALDVLGRRRRVTAEGEEKICRKVLHFDCCKEELLVQLSLDFFPTPMRGTSLGKLTFGWLCFGGTGDSINLTASWAETETSSSVELRL
jgi:hypothetical protein